MRTELRLYVSGKSASSIKAIKNLEALCRDGDIDLEVIDILERPDLAERDKIVATPTLMRRLPPPVRKVIGDLSRKADWLWGLNMSKGSSDE